MTDTSEIRRQVADACHRLHAKGLVGDSGGSFSLRIPGRTEMALAPDGTDFSAVTPDDVRILPLAPGPEDAIAAPGAALHAAVYRTRPDAGAAVHSHQHWAAGLGRLPQPMPGVFDEQVRQLGRSVQRLPGDGGGLTSEALRRLRRHDNAFLFGDGVLCIGVTGDRAVFNAELIEKCAKAFILAFATGRPVGTVPLLVREIAHRRMLKDQRRSAAAWSRGEIPTGFTAY